MSGGEQESIVPLLDVKNLNIGFFSHAGQVTAVNNVSFSIEPQQSLGLVGESGSGKSLSALSIMRLEPSNAIISGEIQFKGKNIFMMNERALRQLRGNKISIIYQNPMSALNPVLSIGKQIGETIASHRPISKNAIKKETIDLLEQVRLPDAHKAVKRYPFEFSGGMLQRVVIAMALANKPELLLADEPTTALDVTIQAQMLSLMNDLKKNYSLSMLFITHNLALVKKICDKVAVIYAGQIMEISNTEKLLESPLHPYTRSLIGIVVSLESTKKKPESIPGVIPSPWDRIPGCRFHERCNLSNHKCRNNIPMLREVEKEHYVACHAV